MAYTYMVRCADGSIYTGIAKDLCRRMQEHYYKKKPGAKYTRSRQIVSLAMVWETDGWSDAAKLEARIKSLTRPKKEVLVQNPEKLKEYFGEYLESSRYRPRPDLTLEMCLDKKMGDEGPIRGEDTGA